MTTCMKKFSYSLLIFTCTMKLIRVQLMFYKEQNKKGFDTDRINEALAAVYLKSGDAKNAIQYTKDELLKIQCMFELGEIQEAYAKLNNLPDGYKTLPRYYTLQAQYCYSSRDFKNALNYIKPELGHLPLNKIVRSDVQKLINDNQEHPRTCEIIRLTLVQILNSAIDDKLLHENVAKK